MTFRLYDCSHGARGRTDAQAGNVTRWNVSNWRAIHMEKSLSQKLRELPSVLRWRGPFRLLLLVAREVLSPLVYWHVFHIFETDLRLPLPESYARERFEVRVYSGSEDLEAHQAELASMGELQPSEIATRFRRGDVAIVAYEGSKPVGYVWLIFSSGVELAFRLHWILNSHEALRHGSYVLPDWRGRGIHSFLNHAVNHYARQHGIIRTLASISVLNTQSLSLANHFQKAPTMTLIVLRVRGVNWTYRRAIGAPLKSRFSTSYESSDFSDIELSAEKSRAETRSRESSIGSVKALEVPSPAGLGQTMVSPSAADKG